MRLSGIWKLDGCARHLRCAYNVWEYCCITPKEKLLDAMMSQIQSLGIPDFKQIQWAKRDTPSITNKPLTIH